MTEILTVREKPRTYRAIHIEHDHATIVVPAGTKVPEHIERTTHTGFPPFPFWLLLDQHENTIVGWATSLEDYEVMEAE